MYNSDTNYRFENGEYICFAFPQALCFALLFPQYNYRLQMFQVLVQKNGQK